MQAVLLSLEIYIGTFLKEYPTHLMGGSYSRHNVKGATEVTTPVGQTNFFAVVVEQKCYVDYNQEPYPRVSTIASKRRF